jgi:hypothetical protein
MSEGRILSEKETLFLREEETKVINHHRFLLDNGYHYTSLATRRCGDNDTMYDQFMNWIQENKIQYVTLRHIFVTDWLADKPFEYADMIYFSNKDFMLFKLVWW